MLKDNPYILFVFGDNFQEIGYGGQAKEMRNEPNAVGIFTKRFPSMNENAFLTDDDYGEWAIKVRPKICRLLEHVYDNGVIVLPKDGIGTGLAQLETRAPKIFQKIRKFESRLNEYCKTL